MILVVGGGVIGLSVGWQLARRGMAVRILDNQGNAASYVAAGMLTPYTDDEYENKQLQNIAEESLRLYPQFLRELYEDCGHEVQLEKCGTLYVGIDSDDMAILKRMEFKGERLNGPQVRELEPFLSPRVNCGIYVEKESQIDNRALLKALQQAFINCGGSIQYTQVKEIVSGCVQLENNELLTADTVINCTGAFASKLTGAEVIPNKGQILTVKSAQLKHIVRSPRVYLVPKKDETLRIGATSEDCGFNQEVTAGGCFELLENAREIFPGVDYCQLLECTAALRPQTHDRMPIIGENKIAGCLEAVGHGRMGILLAPYTAEVLCRSMAIR